MKTEPKNNLCAFLKLILKMRIKFAVLTTFDDFSKTFRQNQPKTNIHKTECEE